MFTIRNPDRRYAIKPVNLIMANESKAPVFLSRRVRLKKNEAAIVGLRMKNYNELSDNKILLDNEERPLRQCLVEYP